RFDRSTRPPLTAAEPCFMSVVLARPLDRPVARPPADHGPAGLATTLPSQHILPERVPIYAAVRPLGAALEWFPDGSVLAVLRIRGSAPDQAVQAARTALALRQVGVSGPMVIASGLGELASQKPPVGQVVDRAFRLIEAAGTEDSGALR